MVHNTNQECAMQFQLKYFSIQTFRAQVVSIAHNQQITHNQQINP
jgi:hypothetical protein